MKKIIFMFMLMTIAVFNAGCIQEKTFVPVSVIKGTIKVPSGKVATGVKIRVAGESNYAYANEKGAYSIEMKKEGHFLLMAYGIDFDVNFAWVDSVLEDTVTAPDIRLNSKIVGESIWMANTVDYPNASAFKIKAISPSWQSDEKMYDDGTHGDIVAGDGIFTLRKNNLISGLQQYKIVSTENGSDKTSNDPNAEQYYNSNSTIYIAESSVKTVSGYVTAEAATDVFSTVKVASNKGARSVYANSSGQFTFDVQGTGKEYLVFRSPSFEIQTKVIDLSKSSTLNVGEISLTPKVARRVKMVCIRSEFSDASGEPFVMGDFNNWRQDQMFDDGTYGDEVAGDGVYTRVYEDVSYTGSESLKYQFCVNGTSKVRDPYEESHDGDYSTITMKY